MCPFELNENNAAIPILTQVLHRHAEESISDEQVKRLLDKVFERIDAGEFGKQTVKIEKPHGKQNFKLHLAQMSTSEMTVVMIVKLERF